MSRKKKYDFLDENMTVAHYYFKNNEHLASLIDECIKRFFLAVENLDEPQPFIEYDSQQNIIESIRLNSLYNDTLICNYDLSKFENAKSDEETAKEKKAIEQQKIVEFAKKKNACRFISPDGAKALFSKSGRFLVTLPEVSE